MRQLGVCGGVEVTQADAWGWTIVFIAIGAPRRIQNTNVDAGRLEARATSESGHLDSRIMWLVSGALH
jgi:hypothetical protein